MKKPAFKIRPIDLIQGTSVAIKIMLDCPLDFLEKELKERVRSELEEYTRSTMAKTVADHCVKAVKK